MSSIISSPEAETTLAPVRGSARDGVEVFLGLPYAAAPSAPTGSSRRARSSRGAAPKAKLGV